MTILVGEDDPDLLDLICFALRREGHDVIAVSDGASILDVWKTVDEPELVLLDSKLPTVNAWDLSREIRTGSKTPIILLVSADDPEVNPPAFSAEAQAASVQADGYLTWPFSHTELITCVGSALTAAAPMGAAFRGGKATPGHLVKGWQVFIAGARPPRG